MRKHFILIIIIIISCVHANAQWTSITPGLNAQGLTMAEFEGNLFIGKLNFSTPDEVNMWDGTTLTRSTPSPNGPLAAFLIDSGNLYISGGFTDIGGTNVSDVAKWNGQKWVPLGNEMNNLSVNAMIIYNNELYAAGYATNSSLSGLSNFTIAKWNGSKWVDVGGGLQGGDVFSLTVYKNELYAAGSFTSAGGAPATHLAKWNGTKWSAVGSGTTNGGVIYIVKAYNGELYAGGDFSTICDLTTNCLAKWDGTNWTKVGTAGNGTDNTVIALTEYNNELYIGGAFSSIGGIQANHIVKWDGTNWSKLGSGIGTLNNPNEQVWYIAPYKNDIYATGVFQSAGGTPAANLAKWSSMQGIEGVFHDTKHLKIYPNPVSQNSVIEFTTYQKTDVSIEVNDLLGHKVLSEYKKDLAVGIHQYPLAGIQTMNPGIYLVRIITNDGIFTDKLKVE